MSVDPDFLPFRLSNRVTTSVIEAQVRSLQLTKELTKKGIVFLDLSSVHSIDSASLSLILVFCRWLRKSKKKDIYLKLPEPTLSAAERRSPSTNAEVLRRRRGLHQFLTSFRLREIYSALAIRIADDVESALLADTEPPPINDFRVLQSEATLKAFLTSLKEDHQTGLFLRSAFDSDLITSGKLRDIILFELGTNVFEHAKAKSSYTALSRLDIPASQAPSWMVKFAHELAGKPCLEVVVADDGRGVVESLQEGEAQLIGEEAEWVEYAFHPHSTRKSRAERLQRYAEVLGSSEHSQPIPPTGLYWVKEVCREFGGLLALRTGATLIYYDFLNSPDQEKAAVSPKITWRGKRANQQVDRPHLPGTQLFLYFPIDRSGRARHLSRAVTFTSKEVDTHQGQVRSVPIHETPSAGITLDDSSGQAQFILGTIDKIQEQISFGSDLTTSLIIDLRDLELSTKALFILVTELMRLQTTTSNIVLINASSASNLKEELNDLLLNEMRSKLQFPRERPLLIFDNEWRMHLIGAEPAIEKRIQIAFAATRTAQDIGVIRGEIASNRLHHLLRIRQEDDQIEWFISRRDLRRVAESNLRRSLGQYLDSPTTGILHNDRWFLIPSGFYVFGFFELRKLLERDASRDKFQAWCRIIFEELRVQAVIVLGLLAAELQSTLQPLFPRLTFVKISPGDWNHSSYKMILLEPGTKVVILLASVVTGRTVELLLDKLPSVDVQGIVCAVDSRQQDESGKTLTFWFDDHEITVFSALRYPLPIATDLPIGCSYDDIIVIDPISASPLLGTEPRDLIIRHDQAELLSLLKDSDSLAIGHFRWKSRHILYFAITTELARHFAVDFASIIRDDVLLHYQKRRAEPRITAIVYPEESRGSDLIAKQLAANFDGTTLLALAGRALENPGRFPWSGPENLDDVVLFDNAIGSGETFWRMVGVLEAWGAKRIFAYALLRRTSHDVLTVHEKVKRFGSAELELRYLYDLRIPNYSSVDCPVCRDLRRYQSLLGTKLPSSERQRLEEKLERLQSRPVRLLADLPTRLAFLRGDLNDRIESIRFRIFFEEARTDPKARNALAELVRAEESAKRANVVRMCSVLAREAAELLDENVREELFYKSFRHSFVAAIMENLDSDTLSPEEVEEHLIVLHHLDSEEALRSVGRYLPPERQETLLILFTMSNNILEPSRPREGVRKVPQGELSTPLQRLLYSGGESDSLAALSNEKVADTLRAALREISPSWSPSWPCEYVLTTMRDFCHGRASKDELIEVLQRNWREVVAKTNVVLMPLLHQLTEGLVKSRASISTATALWEAIEEVKLLFSTLADLQNEALFKAGNLEVTAEDFEAGIEVLKSRLFGSDSESIFGIVTGVVSEIRALARNVVAQRGMRDIFGRLGVELILDMPDEACYVFGHPYDLVLALSNLLENFEHAFADPDIKERKALLYIVKDKEAKTVTVNIRDTGRLHEPVVKKIGLSRVEAIVSSLDGKLDLPHFAADLVYKTEVTLDLQLISEELLGHD